MARAAVECVLSDEEGDGLAKREPDRASGVEWVNPAKPAVATAAKCPAERETGRQSSPPYVPSAPPAVPDPRLPAEPDDELPVDDVTDADGLLPGEAAALAREEGRKALAADDGRNIGPEYDPEHPDDLDF